MPSTFPPILITSVITLLIYSITFSIYKRKSSRKFFTMPLLLLMTCAVITLLMAAYAEKYVKMYIVAPICIGSLVAYPVFSSAILVRKAPAGKKRWLFFILGVISSILYSTALLHLLSISSHTTLKGN